MNELLYSNINENFEYLDFSNKLNDSKNYESNNNYNKQYTNEHFMNYKENIINNNCNNKNLKYIFQKDYLDQILLCQKSKNYILQKIFEKDLLLKILFKIKNLDSETLITLLLGMLILLLINIFLKYNKYLIY